MLQNYTNLLMDILYFVKKDVNLQFIIPDMSFK